MQKNKKKSTTTPEEMMASALKLIDAQKYKEAIILYKKLLQTSESSNDALHEQLAHCYIQRALSFGRKAMYKEAIVLWENHLTHSQPPYAAYEQYILWLIQINNRAKLQQHLKQLSAEQFDKQYSELATNLGLRLITHDAELADYLPQDSTFINQFKTLQPFLETLSECPDTVELKNILKPLPYRSAFKDLGLLLKSCFLGYSPEKSRAILAKIPEKSAYFQSARLLSAYYLEGMELAQTLIDFTPQERETLYALKQFKKNQCQFIEQFCRQHTHLSAKIQLNITLDYQNLIDKNSVKSFCQKLIATYPAGRKIFFKTVSPNHVLENEFELYRHQAIHHEQENNYNDAEYAWVQCIKLLSDTTPEDRYKIALILRHLSLASEEAERTMYIMESLKYDATDKPSYLHILNVFLDDPEEYRDWLAKALKQLPDDIEILGLALKQAIDNKTYTKANQFAKKILAIDPLNTYAKQALCANSLTYSQQLMREKNYPLVEKHIHKAEKITPNKHVLQQVHIAQALYCFAQHDKAQGLQQFLNIIKASYKDPINQQFHATLAVLLTGLPVATLTRELFDKTTAHVNSQQLNTLITQIKSAAHYNENKPFINKALDKIKMPLKSAIISDENNDLTLQLHLYKTLDSLQNFELLRHIAKHNHKLHQNPIWLYYKMYAQHYGNGGNCKAQDILQLNNALNKARAAEDHQTEQLIINFRNQYYEAHPERNLNFLDKIFGYEETENIDKIEQLFGHISEQDMDSITQRSGQFLQKTNLDAMIAKLFNNTRYPHEMVYMAIMKNPDLLTALTIFGAAEKAKIETGVDIHDIMNTFNILETPPFSPFH